MKPPTALIAEDEPVLRAELRELLGRLWPELQVVADVADGVHALQALESQRPDVLFLDIEMPGSSGLAVARHAAGRCHVVFVTAYSRYALEAFDAGAVDYLLKPLVPERVATALSRLRQRLRDTPPDLSAVLQRLGEGRATEPRHLRWITVAQGRHLQLVTCSEIRYLQADNKYTMLVTRHGRPLISKTIRELVTELDPEMFVQIHRGTIVNLHAIASIERDLRGGLTVLLRDLPDRLAVSARFAHHFRHV